MVISCYFMKNAILALAFFHVLWKKKCWNGIFHANAFFIGKKCQNSDFHAIFIKKCHFGTFFQEKNSKVAFFMLFYENCRLSLFFHVFIGRKFRNDIFNAILWKIAISALFFMCSIGKKCRNDDFHAILWKNATLALFSMCFIGKLF